MARIPPPTAPLTTTATDSVGCHTPAKFARVGGQRDLVADLVADQIENHNTNKLKKLHKSYTKKRRNLHGHALNEIQSLQIENNKRSKPMGVGQNMTTQTTNTAREYCHAIECELIALENLLDCEAVRTDDDDERLLEAYAELEFENTGDAADAIHQWINETLLEFKILRTDDRSQARIEMLRTCGGPHCEITRDSNDGQVIAVTTYDGTQQATTRNTYPHLSQFIDDIAQ